MLGGTWLAQLAKHVTLDLGVVNSSPILAVEFIFFFLNEVLYRTALGTH